MGEPATSHSLDMTISVQELLDRGYSVQEISDAIGVPSKQIRLVIKEMAKDKQLLEEYRGIQPLQLLSLQQRLLMGVTETKINDAPLRDIVGAFKILKQAEHLIDGKPTEIHGLVGYLDVLEKEERGEIDITPVEPETSNFDSSPGDDLPCL